MQPPPLSLSRRDFLSSAASCSAHLALVAAVAPQALQRLWARPRGMVVAREPFGNLEQIGDGVWALISTPLTGDRTTLSNGGLIAGRTGVLAIEGFNQPEGSRWLATRSRELTGRWPTHVALTHFHADHANGVAGYMSAGEKPIIHSTSVTRTLVLERNLPADASRTDALKDATMIDAATPSIIDLGGRVVRITPRAGHTPSDCMLEIDDPSVMFCGDLMWNGMFPNYVDAMPAELTRSVNAIRRTSTVTYIPGHGAVAKQPDFDRYVSMLSEIERAARAAHAKGQTAAEAGQSYALPASLGEWVLFNKIFFERAFAAWYKELG